MRLLLTGFFLLLPLLGKTQNSSIGYSDSLFGYKLNTYQKWLDTSGLGQLLYVEPLYSKTLADQIVILALGFKGQNQDALESSWNSIKQQFQDRFRYSLEDELFYKMIFIFEAPFNSGILIRNSYDNNKTLVYQVSIGRVNGRVKVETHKPQLRGSSVNNPEHFARPDLRFDEIKLNQHPIELDLTQIKGIQTRKMDRDRIKPFIFREIYNFVETKIERKDIPSRKPILMVLDTLNMVHLEVKNLTKEVLRDASEPWLCSLRNMIFYKDPPWNCYPIEMIQYKVIFDDRALIRNKVLLQITLEVKVGAGFPKVGKDRAYREVAPEYLTYVTKYTKEFLNQLRDYLMTGQIR